MRVFSLRGIDGMVVMAVGAILAIVVGIQVGNVLSDSGVSVQSGVSVPFDTSGDGAALNAERVFRASTAADPGTVSTAPASQWQAIDQALADHTLAAGGAATADRIHLQAAASAADPGIVSTAPTSQWQAIDQALAEASASSASVPALPTSQWQAIDQALADHALAAGGAATADQVHLQAAPAATDPGTVSTVPESWLGMYRAYTAANAPAIATDVPESWLGMYRAYTVAQEATFASEATAAGALDWSAYVVALSPTTQAVEPAPLWNVFHE